MTDKEFDASIIKNEIPRVKFWLFILFTFILMMVNSYLAIIYILGTCFIRFLVAKYSHTEYDYKEVGISLAVSVLLLYGQYNMYQKEQLKDTKEKMISQYSQFIDNLTKEEYQEFKPHKKPYWNIYLNYKIGDRDIEVDK
ncbi:MAG: hypothetical protein KAQ94_05950 [Arcobacteraceae bacterium]|nr:hypothetical protein [Arcobacteraceae bacterium]